MLYIVSTPIGNLEDISLRALRILQEVDLIAAEDTRHTGKLLKHYEINTRQLSYHEHNKEARSRELIQKMEEGQSVALVSDAGTPGISDPGFYLIRQAQQEGLPVTCIPGATAFVPALLLSGCPVDQFQFIGFLPPKTGKKKAKLEQLKDYPKTVIAYESPFKLLKTLQLMREVLGDIRLTLCRELTKMHEDVQSQLISEWLVHYQTATPRGEFVLVFVIK